MPIEDRPVGAAIKRDEDLTRVVDMIMEAVPGTDRKTVTALVEKFRLRDPDGADLIPDARGYVDSWLTDQEQERFGPLIEAILGDKDISNRVFTAAEEIMLPPHGQFALYPEDGRLVLSAYVPMEAEEPAERVADGTSD